jgi:hypothetical protein
LADRWKLERWATIFVWIGANAITLYFLISFVSFERVATRLVGGGVGRFLDEAVAPGSGRFVSHLLGVVLAVAFAGLLYRRKIFLRV